MSFGIQTFDNSGRNGFDSSNRIGFFNGSKEIKVTTENLGKPSGFEEGFWISNPKEDFSYHFDDFGGFHWYSVAGLSGGNTFYAPIVHDHLGWVGSVPVNVGDSGVIPLSSECLFIGNKKGAEHGYGLLGKSVEGFLNVDQESTPMFLQPATNGSAVQQADIIYGMETYNPTGGRDFNLRNVQNVVFPKAYKNPPYIFITDTLHYLSFVKYFRNTNEEYIGAMIIREAPLNRNVVAPDNAGLGAYIGNPSAISGHFSYFLVSDEIPNYLNISDNYGMRIINNSGNLIFDSRYILPDLFNPYNIPLPQTRSDFYGNYWTVNDFDNSHTSSLSGGIYGVCINNFNAVTGTDTYRSRAILGQLGMGPNNISGKFMRVSQENNGFNLKAKGMYTGANLIVENGLVGNNVGFFDTQISHLSILAARIPS